MAAKTVIILFLLQPFVEQSIGYILDRKLDYSDCKSICSTSDGRADFDIETKMCKCSLQKNIDDTDIELIHKTARIMGKQLNEVSPIDHSTIIIKREVQEGEETEETSPTEPSTTTLQGIEVTTLISNVDDNTTPTSTFETEKPEVSAEEIVGQPRRRVHHRLVAQRRHPPRPITPEQQRIIMQQMRDHLSRLSQTTDPRARQYEIDAIRANLRHLSQTTTVPQTPQQRARTRNIVEESRRRQQRQRLLHNSRLVGASAPNDDSTLKKEVHDIHENNVEGALKEIFHHRPPPHFDIVTQDPRLIDE